MIKLGFTTVVASAALLVAGCNAGSAGDSPATLHPAAFSNVSQRVNVKGVDCPSIKLPIPSPTGLLPGYDVSRPAYKWVGTFGSCKVLFHSQRTGAWLFGVAFFPPDITQSDALHPGIVIGPGSVQGVQANYQWLGRYLAAHGYVTLTVDPQGVGKSETTALQGAGRLGLANIPYQQLGNYIDALRSGLDFLDSKNNPVQKWTRSRGFGLAGHSLSARAASTLQATDIRVDAIVAMDNLSSNRQGDAGILAGGGLTGGLAGGEIALQNTPNMARVPALGLGSDGATLDDLFRSNPNTKKTGYLHWRAAGLPTMEIVFRGSKHGDFARKPGKHIAMQQLAAYYARAWFDRYLQHGKGHQHDRSRLPKALLAKQVAGKARSKFLSTTYKSAAFFPAAGIDCPDLHNKPCPASGAGAK